MKEYFKKMLKNIRVPAAIGILLWPSAAMADPASALMLLGAVLTKTAIAWVGYTLIAGTIIYGTIDARRRARNAAENAKNEFNRNLQDRSQTVLTQLPPWVIRYGRTIAGSTVVAVFTTDKNGVRQNGETFVKKDAYKHIVYVHASHECAAVHGYRINGVDVGELDDNGWALNPVFKLPAEYGYSTVKTVEIPPSGSHVAANPVQILKAYDKSISDTTGPGYPVNIGFYFGNIPSGAYTISGDGKTITNTSGIITLVVTYAYVAWGNTLRISTHLGSPTQTVDTYLNGLIPDKWTANHRLRGRCYSVVTVDLENTDFQGGIPQFEADLSGRLLFDPRSSTTAYGQNWALVVRDWLTSVWGADADPIDVDDASVITSANASDVSISVSKRSYTDTSLWAFTATADGFTGINCTATPSSGALTVTGTVINTPFAIQRTGLSIVGASNRYVRARIRRLAGVSWEGVVQYSTAGHGYSTSYYAVKPVGMKISGAYQEVVWDMHSLRNGANDWKNSTITGIAILLGKGLGESFQVDWVSISNESTITVTEPKYTVNAVFDTSESRESVLNNLLLSGAGNAYNGGEWIVVAGAWSSPIMTLTDNDLVGQVQIVQADAGLDELFNGVRGTYFEAGKSVAKEMKPYSVPVLVTEDGKELWEDIAFPYTDNEQRVQNLARIMVERVRSGQIIQYPASLRAFPLRIGDRVAVSNSEYVFVAKTYMVTDWNFGQTSPVLLTLQEDSAAVWDLADQVVYDQTPNTQLADPRYVLPFLDSDITIQSGTAHLIKEADGSISTRIFITWPVSRDSHMEGDNARVDIIWQRVLRDDPNTWRRVEFPANQRYAYLLGAVSGDTVIIGIRPRNSLGFAAEYTYVTHEVVGETQPPSDVTGFSATPFAGEIRYSWDDCTDVDYEDTELRIGTSWATATRVFKGKANTYTYPQAVPATITMLARHYDRSGNESSVGGSATASSLSLNDTRNYDFTNGLAGWTGISSVATGDSGASGGTYGVHGGGIGAIAYPQKVPVDPQRRYRVTGRLWADSGGGGLVYVGVVPFDASGNILSNSGGATYPYCAASGVVLAGPGWRVFSGEISGTQAIPNAAYETSKFPVGTVYAAPACFPYTGYTGPLLIDYLVIEDITDAKAVEAEGFSVYRMWDFNSGTTEGLTPVNATMTASAGVATLTATTSDPQIIIDNLSFSGATFDKIRIRVRRVSGSSWQGTIYYAKTNAYDYSESFKLSVPAEKQPSSTDWTILEWDAAKHASNLADWLTANIYSLRIDLSQGGVGDSFDIDWIAIGRSGGGSDLSSTSNAQWIGRGVSVVGDTATKTLPSTGWDSDVYSREQFYGGAAASASFVDISRPCCFGLNADPLSNASYTSLDYGFYLDNSSGGVFAVESGSVVTLIDASPSVDAVYTVAYDGSRVNYMKNGSLLRSVIASAGLSFFFDSSFYAISSGLKGMRFGPLSANNWSAIGGDAKPSDYASADLKLINEANCVQNGNRVTKVAGGDSWNGGMRSADAYLGGAACSVVVHSLQTTSGHAAMFGLNNASVTSSYTDINFAMYLLGTGGGVGNLYAYGEGSDLNGGTVIGTFSDNDILGVTYDGHKARWYRNGALIFEYTSVDTTSRWFFDCSIVQVGEFLDRISFRPLSMVSGITSVQLANDIQSDNYDPGVEGWRISRDDGSAEFGAASIRGPLSASNIIGSSSGTTVTGWSLTVSGGQISGQSAPSDVALDLELPPTGNHFVSAEISGQIQFNLASSFSGGGGTYSLEIYMYPYSQARVSPGSWTSLVVGGPHYFKTTVVLTGSEVFQVPFSLTHSREVDRTYNQWLPGVTVSYARFVQLAVNGGTVKTDCLSTANLSMTVTMRQFPN